MNYYNQTAEGVLESLSVNPDKGLSSEEVDSRRKLYGLNELKKKKKTNPIFLFFNQFRSFIIYILIFAVVISVISGEFTDAIVILIILLFNAIFGFIQEFKAEKAIEALRKISALKAKVIRNGKAEMIDTKNLVNGDIIVLEEGNKVPADARIIESNGLRVSEASLTGEPIAVSKAELALNGDLVIQDRKNMLFSGTEVTRGRGRAVVTSIGMKTEIGKIAKMISDVDEELTPLQKKLGSLGRKIGVVTIVICLMVFFVGVVKEGIIDVLFSQGIIEFVFASKVWFLTAISLAVAAVPEGLPAIVTIALAMGVRKMVGKKALIRKLPSVETLGEATVICSDKTGTLTKNEMTVRLAYVDMKQITIEGEGYDINGRVLSSGNQIDKRTELIFKIGALCNNASLEINKDGVKVSGDPTEVALLVSAEKVGIKIKDITTSWNRTKEEPFDSVRKLMSTVNSDPETKESFVFTKGAPENLLDKCNRIIINGNIRNITFEDKKVILAKNDEFANQALRVLGFAYKKHLEGEEFEQDLVFVGLQGMIDPPHHEVKYAIQRCKDAGIRVIMITGDNGHTAEAIGKEIGIEAESMDGPEFSKLSEEEQEKAIEKVSIFSRVEPSHKMVIVTLLERKGEVVAMTGDGVNDAPAIKKADLGIAMGITGTDVAKESSDMVLLDDNFASIVNAVEEGRGIYENIRKFVNYLLSCNLGEVMVIFFAILLGFPLPMTAIMILWLNLVTDGLPALALSVDPNPTNLMKKPPKKIEEGIMNKSMMFNIGYVSVLITIGVLGLFYWAMIHYQGIDGYLGKIQTIAFTSIIVMEFVRLYTIRSEYKLELFSNKYLLLAVFISLALQLMVIYSPIRMFFGTAYLSFVDWFMIIIVSAAVFVFNLVGTLMKRRLGLFKA